MPSVRYVWRRLGVAFETDALGGVVVVGVYPTDDDEAREGYVLVCEWLPDGDDA